MKSEKMKVPGPGPNIPVVRPNMVDGVSLRLFKIESLIYDHPTQTKCRLPAADHNTIVILPQDF